MSEQVEVPNHSEILSEDLRDNDYVKQRWEGRSQDQLLQWIVEHTNVNGNEHRITLTVGGSLISGILIAADTYIEEIADQFSSVFDAVDGTAEDIRSFLLSWKVSRNEDEDKNVVPQFIHLRNAEVFTSNGRPIVSGGSLWRGKISSVDGFNLGRLEFIKKSEESTV